MSIDRDLKVETILVTPGRMPFGPGRLARSPAARPWSCMVEVPQGPATFRRAVLDGRKAEHPFWRDGPSGTHQMHCLRVGDFYATETDITAIRLERCLLYNGVADGLYVVGPATVKAVGSTFVGSNRNDVSIVHPGANTSFSRCRFGRWDLEVDTPHVEGEKVWRGHHLLSRCRLGTLEIGSRQGEVVTLSNCRITDRVNIASTGQAFGAAVNLKMTDMSQCSFWLGQSPGLLTATDCKMPAETIITFRTRYYAPPDPQKVTFNGCVWPKGAILKINSEGTVVINGRRPDRIFISGYAGATIVHNGVSTHYPTVQWI